MWDLIVSVPDHCLSFYFDAGTDAYNLINIERESKQSLSRTTCGNLLVLNLDKSYLPLQVSRVG